MTKDNVWYFQNLIFRLKKNEQRLILNFIQNNGESSSLFNLTLFNHRECSVYFILKSLVRQNNCSKSIRSLNSTKKVNLFARFVPTLKFPRRFQRKTWTAKRRTAITTTAVISQRDECTVWPSSSLTLNRCVHPVARVYHLDHYPKSREKKENL